MKIQGDHVFPAPRATVWDAVLDPETLTRVLPGCEDFHEVGENEFEGVLKIKVGPVQGKFQGKVRLTDLQEPESYRLHLNGKGAPGFVDGQGELRLEDAGAETRLHYEIDAKVGGRIASVGQRLLDSTTRSITRQALEGLEKRVVARAEAEAGGEPAAEVEIEAPSQSEVAAEVAKDVLADLVPPERRPLYAAVAAAVVLAAAALFVKTC